MKTKLAMMRTHKAFLEEIKDLLEENGAGHLFKAIKKVFYKYIERILDRAAWMWPPRRGHLAVDTLHGHQDGDVWSWPPALGCQDVVTRKGVPGHGRQDVVTRKGPPGRGLQDVAARMGLPGSGH